MRPATHARKTTKRGHERAQGRQRTRTKRQKGGFRGTQGTPWIRHWSISIISAILLVTHLSLEEVDDDGLISGEMVVPCLSRHLVVRTTITVF